MRATKVKASFIFEVENIRITPKMEEALTLVALTEIPREVIGKAFVYINKATCLSKRFNQLIRERMEAMP